MRLKNFRYSPPIFFAAVACLLFGSTAPVSAEDSLEYYYPNPGIFTNGIVRAVLFRDGKLYIGGNFTEVTGANGTYDRTDLAAYDAATGNVTRFQANTNRGTVRTIVVGSGKLFAGGSFTEINGTARSKVAAVDTATGEVVNGFRENAGTIEGTVWALAYSGRTLYLGGDFTSIDGYTRNFLASMDSDTGKLDMVFDPAPSDPWDDSGRTAPGVYALEIHPNNPDIVFAGGNFQTIAGFTDRQFLAALHSDGTPGPQFDNPVNAPIHALDADESFLCVAVGGYTNRVMAYGIGSDPYVRQWKGTRAQGDVQTVACTPQGYVYFGFHEGLFDTSDLYRMAVLDANTGEIFDAYPPMNSFFGVWAIDVTDSCLAVGGEFTRMNGLTQKYFAVFKTVPYSVLETLPLEAPRLSYPENGEIGLPLTPRFEWKFVPRASTYELQVSTDREFSNVMVNVNELTGFSTFCAGFANTTFYWWRVRARNGGGVSDWSEIGEFVTAPGAGEMPEISNPVDGSVDQPVACNLCWHPTVTGITYGIQIAKAVDTGTTIIYREGIVDTSFSVSGFENNTAYYWRVNAMTIGGPTAWTAASFRTVVAEPETPRCLAPVHDASQIMHQPALLWKKTGESASYRVQVSADSCFAAMVFDTSGLTDTSIVIDGLADDTRYFWRVNAVNPGGASWSLPMRFTTVFPLPYAPHPIAPRIGRLVTTDTLHLLWNQSSPHVTKYWVEIANDSTMRGAVIDSTAVDTEFVRHNLDNKTEFWWRVRAYNETGWGEFSEKRRFKTAYPPAWVRKFSLDRFSVSRMHGSILYRVAEKCDVFVELYDLNGNIVWKTAKEDIAPGLYRDTFSSVRFPAGAYLLSFKAGSYSKTVNAMLVR